MILPFLILRLYVFVFSAAWLDLCFYDYKAPLKLESVSVCGTEMVSDVFSNGTQLAQLWRSYEEYVCHELSGITTSVLPLMFAVFE